MLKTRVTHDIKEVVESLARQQQVTESAWLRQLITTTLQTTGVSMRERISTAAQQLPRSARLMIRFLPEDQLLLQARAHLRGMPGATYASAVLRAHLRGTAPIPKDELQALKRAIAELGAIGRNLNQLARAANQGSRTAGPSREELRALLRACEGLRDHVRRLLEVNVRSWETGNAEAPD